MIISVLAIRRPGTVLNGRMWAATAHRQSTRRARRVIATYRVRGGPQFDDRRQAIEVAKTLPNFHTGPSSGREVLRRRYGHLDLRPRRRRHAEHAGPVPRGARDARKLYLHGPAPPRTGAVAPALYVVSVSRRDRVRP